MPATSIYPPITLPLNMWLGALTCLINYTQTANTNQGAFDIDLLNETQDINVADGNGKLILSADLPTAKDYAKVSSLLTVTDPIVAEQYVALTKFRTIPLSISMQFMRLSFNNETDSATFSGYVISLMTASKNVNLYEEIVELMENWVPTPFDDTKPISSGKRGQKTSMITVDLWDISTLTDITQINEYQTYNSNTIYNTLLNVKANLIAPSTDFNEQGMKEYVSNNELKAFINSYFENFLTINTLATLLNSNKITENGNNVKKYTQIPQIMLSEDNKTKIICWLGHGKKFQWGYFYNLATAFFDASNLTTNNWLHYSYYMTTVDNYPMLKVIANFKPITPPAKTEDNQVVKEIKNAIKEIKNILAPKKEIEKKLK